MKLASSLLAATALVALAGCNRTAGNNSAAANMNTTNAAAPAPAAANSAAPAAGDNSAKPADQPADMNMPVEEGVSDEAGPETNGSK